MNEEEKQAIETLQGLCTDDCINKDVVQTVVNLIYKQQKEIEKLKSRKYIFNAETNEIKEIPISDDYISKDKMKAKKEEYKKKCDECYFNKSRICKELKAYNCCPTQGALELLNELLGE